MARILVVDDLPHVARAIARMLHNHETVIETDPRRVIARVVADRFEPQPPGLPEPARGVGAVQRVGANPAVTDGQGRLH